MPLQISPGETFVNGQQVDASRLNNLAGHAILLPGSVTEQPDIGSVIDQTDKLIIYDNSANALRSVTINNLMGSVSASNITTLTTSVINGQPNSDIAITANDGTLVSGKAFSSSNGLLVTVTSTAHGLISGQLVSITASNSAYSGLFQVTVASADTFTYSFSTAVTAASGTCNYFHNATVRINGNITTSGNVVITGSVNAGTASVTSLSINGKTPMTTQDNLNKIYTKSGTASGATGATVENLIYQTPTLTIPSDETWTYEFWVQTTSGYVNGDTRADYGSVSLKAYNNTTLLITLNGSTSPYGSHTATFTYTKSFTSADTSPKLILKTFNWWGLNEEPKYVIRLTKVKTATLSDASTCI
jgi:hypothetical protein